ncbi:MAG: hypothetical protein ACRDNO_20445 [Trebonia sp.]
MPIAEGELLLPGAADDPGPEAIAEPVRQVPRAAEVRSCSSPLGCRAGKRVADHGQYGIVAQPEVTRDAGEVIGRGGQFPLGGLIVGKRTGTRPDERSVPAATLDQASLC